MSYNLNEIFKFVSADEDKVIIEVIADSPLKVAMFPFVSSSVNTILFKHLLQNFTSSLVKITSSYKNLFIICTPICSGIPEFQIKFQLSFLNFDLQIQL